MKTSIFGRILIHLRSFSVDDTVSAARHAAQRGWIRGEEIAEVRAHQKEDTEARTLLDRLDREHG